MDSNTPVSEKTLYGTPPLFSSSSPPEYTLTDTTPGEIEPVSSEVLADLKSVDWKTVALETWITSTRRLQQYLTYQWILLARQACQIFDDNGAATFQDRHKLEEGIQKIWSMWKDYVSADTTTPDILYNSPAYFEFKKFNKRFHKPRRHGSVKDGKKMKELLSSAKDLHILSHQIQQILKDVPLRSHNVSGPHDFDISRFSDDAFTALSRLNHPELADDIARDFETSSNPSRGLYQQYPNPATPSRGTSSQDPLMSDTKPESPVPGSNQRPELKDLDIGVESTSAPASGSPVQESTAMQPVSPGHPVRFNVAPFDKKPVPGNDLLALIKPRGAPESEYEVILKSRLENHHINPLNSAEFLQPYLGGLWQNQDYWTIYHDSIRTLLRDHLKNILPQFVLAPMSLMMPDPKSETGVTSYPLILIIVPESYVQSLRTDSLIGGITKEFLIGIATGEYKAYASKTYEYVRPGDPIEVAIPEEVTQGEQKTLASVDTPPIMSYTAASIGPCFEQTGSKQRSCLTSGHMFLNEDNYKMAKLGTSVYCPGEIHFDNEIALCETQIRQQNIKIQATKNYLATLRSKIAASDFDEDELQQYRNSIVAYEGELAAYTGKLQMKFRPRLEEIRNKAKNIENYRLGRLVQTEYDVVNYHGRRCISDWALIDIDKGRNPVKAVRPAVERPSGGVLGAQVWAPFSGRVKELNCDQYVYKEGSSTGLTFGFVAGLMDVNFPLALPGGMRKMDTEEYFVLSEDWTQKMDVPFSEKGDSSAQVVDSGGDAVGTIHGGVGGAIVRLVLNTEGKPDILEFQRRRTGGSLDIFARRFKIEVAITAVMSLKMLCERSGQKEENLMQC